MHMFNLSENSFMAAGMRTLREDFGAKLSRGAIAGLVAGLLVVIVASALLGAAPALATTGKAQVFLNGQVVGAVVTPAAIPNGGVDPFYEVTNGVSGDLIAAVGPGPGDYHGGRWAVSTVTFNPGVAPYLLTSAAAVRSAAMAGDVTVTPDPGADFRCPITQP